MKLLPRVVEKPWGRTDLPLHFGRWSGSRIGEVWFEHPEAQDLPLLVKYIFTSEKLSVQVHPNDAQARERAYAAVDLVGLEDGHHRGDIALKAARGEVGVS